jgi:hypothetical protein
MASTYLTRTVSTIGNRKTFTYSGWIKRGIVSAGGGLFGQGNRSSSDFDIRLESTGTLRIEPSGFDIKTNAQYRDCSAWYHFVIAIDTTQATSTNRVKIYVNGEQVTSLASTTYPSLNYDTVVNSSGSTGNVVLGDIFNSSGKFDGSMAHVHFIDGTAYDASTFGETDATTGIWKPKTAPVVTYGTNGFFLKFENSASFGTDSSPNGNNFTVNGTMTQTIDTPSNVFATLDAIQYKTSALTYSNGNTTVSFPSAWVFALSQLGVSSGKWYWEAKVNSGNNANSYYGICAEMVPAGNGFYNNSQNGAIMYAAGDSGDIYIDGSYTASAQTPQNKDTDILGLALDLDSGTKTLKIYKNGTQLTSGGTVNLSSYYNDTFVFPCFSGNSSSASCSFNLNFGNGVFGSTPLTGTTYSDTAGLGIFKYEVPAGYYALCTKNINTQEYN